MNKEMIQQLKLQVHDVVELTWELNYSSYLGLW